MAPAAVTLVALATLVWALNPRQPKLVPAPLHPPSQECLKLSRAFIPTNITSMPHPSTDALAEPLKYWVLSRLNKTPCPCGCAESVAACHTNNPACETSSKLAIGMVPETQNSVSPSARPSP